MIPGSLNHARSNLAIKTVFPRFTWDLCFEAQQAAEKAIKAVMIMRNIEFPYVHDLSHLLAILEESGEPIPQVVRKGLHVMQ